MTRKERLENLLLALKEPEEKIRSEGYALIAGADEAGRGPLAGPVVAACVLLPPDCAILGVNDSKKLSPARREALFEQICAQAASVSVGVADAARIDEVNIRNAAKEAFSFAVRGLRVQPDFLFTDAIEFAAPCPMESVVKGDAKVYSIAAASIVAKVTRDRMMREYAQAYPQYGFDRNQGYGTREHRAAIVRFGPCPIHRQSFLKNVERWAHEQQD